MLEVEGAEIRVFNVFQLYPPLFFIIVLFDRYNKAYDETSFITVHLPDDFCSKSIYFPLPHVK